MGKISRIIGKAPAGADFITIILRSYVPWSEEGAHAMAAVRSDEGWSFFDPNLGEVSFTDEARFQQWLAEYVDDNYDEMDAFTLQAFS